MKYLPLICIAALLSGCASGPTIYRKTDGTVVASTSAELFHDSDYSLQLVGGETKSSIPVPILTGRTSKGQPLYTSGTATVGKGALLSIRAKPNGTKGIGVFGLMNLGSDLVSGANNAAQDAINSQ